MQRCSTRGAHRSSQSYLHFPQDAKPRVGTRSYSRNVITAFLNLRRHFTEEAMSIDIFTYASLVDHMHEDPFWLALDKIVALVVLPFHRSWSVDRSTVVTDDKAMQNLNRKVLKRASCSVGIFVYWKPLWESQMDGSCYKVLEKTCSNDGFNRFIFLRFRDLMMAL